MVEASDKKDFASLSAEEQTAMVTKINTILTENGLQNSVTVAHKAVMKGNIKEGEFSCKGGLTLKGNLSVSLEGAMNKAVDQVKEALGDVTCEMQMVCKLGVGDQAPTVPEITRLVHAPKDSLEGEEKEQNPKGKMQEQANCSIVCEEGQVVVLELWATWCGPCQGPMKKNVALLKQGKEAWKDKVRIVAMSCDQDLDTLKSAIVERDYVEGIEHYWAGDGKCTINKTLGGGGIPHIALVDTKGKIVYKGHPMGTDLEKDIDTLVAGGELATAEAAGAPVEKHNAGCDSCQKQVTGTRHRCLDCDDYDLCEACYKSDNDTAAHKAKGHTFGAMQKAGDLMPEFRMTGQAVCDTIANFTAMAKGMCSDTDL